MTDETKDLTGKNTNDLPGNDKASDNKSGDAKAKNGPPAFDWITERSACTLPKVFAELRRQLEADVNTRNSIRPNLAPYEFSLTEDIADFKVVLKAKEVQQAVSFHLADHAILVRDDQGKQMFEVTLTFDDAGKCRLNVNAQEREFWQVRRMALEDLMFRGL